MSSPASEPEAGGSPTPEEIILPPLFLAIAGILCFLVLFFVSHWKIIINKLNKTEPNLSALSLVVVKENNVTEEETQIMQNFKTFQNRLPSLTIIVTYPTLTMVFCPLALFLHSALTGYFWPHLDTMPNVNDPLSIFLTPAGVIYAILFAYAAGQVLDKMNSLEEQLQAEVSACRRIALLTAQTSSLGHDQKNAIYRILRSNLINRIQHVQQNSVDKTVNVWNIMKHLRVPMNNTDKLMCQQISRTVSKLSRSIPDAGSLHDKMNYFQWLLLESLGLFTFLGILLIKAESYKLELAMCIITVVSITLLTSIVSDLDSPFHGFYRIDLDFMTEFRTELIDLETASPSDGIKEKA